MSTAAPQPSPRVTPDKEPMAQNKKIYVLDCGGQYCHLIASRLRRHEALSVIVPCDVPVAELNDAAAIVVSGGPQSCFDPDSMKVDPALWQLPVPILGICYGCQMMCRDLGGKVEEAQVGEYGAATLTVTDSSGLLKTANNLSLIHI